MKNKITFVELGYYHPSNANWVYRVHLVIDKTGARLYKETFGGDSRAMEALQKAGFKTEKLSAGKGSGVQYKWGDIKDLFDIASYKGTNWGESSLQ